MNLMQRPGKGFSFLDFNFAYFGDGSGWNAAAWLKKDAAKFRPRLAVIIWWGERPREPDLAEPQAVRGLRGCSPHRLFCRVPLILTFSLREKEQLLVSFLKSVSFQAESRFGFAKTLGAFLPLPAGEGRGEGEPRSIISRRHFT
jgi:hypothetical protein